MPNIKDVISGLKVSVLVALLLGMITVSGYTMVATILSLRHDPEYMSVRLLFLAGFCVLLTLAIGYQVARAIKSFESDEPFDIAEAVLSLQVLTIGGIGITLIALSIYDLLGFNIGRALVESPIGVVTVCVAIQLWLAKTPKQEQHKLLNGAGTIVFAYVLFLASLVPFTGLVTFWFYPETHGNWASLTTFLLPAIAGGWYIFRLPTRKPKSFRQY